MRSRKQASTRSGRRNDQRCDDTNRRSRIIAPVGLPDGSNHWGRLLTRPVIPAHVPEPKHHSEAVGGQPRHHFQPGGLPFDPGYRLERFEPFPPVEHIGIGWPNGCTRRQERERAPSVARRTDKRGGTPPRQKMAVSRRAMHAGRPALSGRPDQAVRNPCVRGKER